MAYTHGMYYEYFIFIYLVINSGIKTSDKIEIQILRGVVSS